MPGRCRFVNILWMSALAAGTLWPRQDFTFRSRSDLVLLDVRVRNGEGHCVTGLSSDDFKVLDDNRYQRISYFSQGDAPATVGLVLDNSGSMESKRRDVIVAGLSFASSSNPHDEFFVVNFNDRLEYGLPSSVPFTDDMTQLHHALYWGRSQGMTRLYDAVASALRHMNESTDKYHVLIVVSDGGDNASKTKLPELLRIAEQSRATIYTVGLMDPDDHDLNPAVLKKLAKLTGGEYFQPAEISQVTHVFRHISDDVRHRYILGYVPDEDNDPRNARTVKVSASEAGHKLAVHTRTTYILNPEPAAMASDRGKKSS